MLGRERRRQITDEPHRVAPELLGQPLGGFRRRMLAYAVDLLLFAVIAGALVLAASLLSLQLEAPGVLPVALDGSAPDSVREAATAELLQVMARRAPEMAPPEITAGLEAGDVEVIRRILEQDLIVGLGSGASELRPTNDGWQLSIGNDLLLGRAAGMLSWGAIFLVWFTVWTRLGHGRPPGKRLLGLRVRRLDGQPLTWWDCFGRAGGYGASAATALLGFLEAAWHPNRQAIHDRIAATVVTRESRKTPPSP